MSVVRMWHAWATPGNADTFESLLNELLLTQQIFVGMQNQRVPGFKSIQLLRRQAGEEVEFVTHMLFDSLDAVREYAGEDYEVAFVSERARAVLSHFDERVQHYEIKAAHLNVIPRTR